MLFRCFLGLNLDEDVWGATTLTKNCDRLQEAEAAKLLLVTNWGRGGRFSVNLHR